MNYRSFNADYDMIPLPDQLKYVSESNIIYAEELKTEKIMIDKIHPSPTLILNSLLSKIQKIDFEKKAGLSGQYETVKEFQKIVIAIDEILDLAISQNWGLCKNNDFIFLFNGAYWIHLNIEVLRVFLGEASHRLGIDILSSKHFLFREKLFKQFMAVANLPAPEKNHDEVLINLQNGTLVITPDSTYLKDFDRNDFITYQLPFSYDESAESPVFSKFLSEVLPEEELQKMLAEFIAYVFIPTKSLKLEKALLLYGTGANGKSVFFDVVNALLGPENVSNYSLRSLTDKSGYYRAMIANKLVNYASEIGTKLETNFFKQIVSGEGIEARLPYGKPHILDNYAKLVFNTNELPHDVEHTEAYFRRFLIIPFNVTIPEEKQNKQLAKTIIATELPGVLNWVLDGLKRLNRQGNFTHSDIVRQQVLNYKNEADSVFMFVDEHGLFPDNFNTEPLKEIYTWYKEFCREYNYRPVSNRNFRKRLESHGFTTKRIANGYVVYTISSSGLPL